MANKIDIKLNDAIMDQENIEKLADKINEVIDEIPVVEANPEGEATTDLTKLQVGDTVYGVGGGIEIIELQWSEKDEEITTLVTPEQVIKVAQMKAVFLIHSTGGSSIIVDLVRLIFDGSTIVGAYCGKTFTTDGQDYKYAYLELEISGNTVTISNAVYYY